MLGISDAITGLLIGYGLGILSGFILVLVILDVQKEREHEETFLDALKRISSSSDSDKR